MSASEAAEKKEFLVLTSRGWKIQKHIPIDYGPRHFYLFEAAEFTTSWQANLRKGDIIHLRFQLSPTEKREIGGFANQHQISLVYQLPRKNMQYPLPNPNSKSVWEMDPKALFLEYMAINKGSQAVIEEGQTILETLQTTTPFTNELIKDCYGDNKKNI